MFQRILVPMDGSRFSQCSLDQVRAVALVPSAPEILILRVVEPLPDDVRNGLVELGGDQITRLEEKRKAEALDYVKSMVKTLKQQGLQVKSDVVFGRPAEEIMNYADKNKFDLIIMSTHGRSEITHWPMGSVADRVANHSKIPVQLVSPKECRTSAGF